MFSFCSRFAFTKDDFLVVIAAGNDGEPEDGFQDKTVNQMNDLWLVFMAVDCLSAVMLHGFYIFVLFY